MSKEQIFYLENHLIFSNSRIVAFRYQYLVPISLEEQKRKSDLRVMLKVLHTIMVHWKIWIKNLSFQILKTLKRNDLTYIFDNSLV